MIFDPFVAAIFDPAVAMIFDPAVINKFDPAVIKDIASRFFDPRRADDFAECPDALRRPRGQRFDDR
jgi:hypothetical protein